MRLSYKHRTETRVQDYVLPRCRRRRPVHLSFRCAGGFFRGVLFHFPKRRHKAARRRSLARIVGLVPMAGLEKPCIGTQPDVYRLRGGTLLVFDITPHD